MNNTLTLIAIKFRDPKFADEAYKVESYCVAEGTLGLSFRDGSSAFFPLDTVLQFVSKPVKDNLVVLAEAVPPVAGGAE